MQQVSVIEDDFQQSNAEADDQESRAFLRFLSIGFWFVLGAAASVLVLRLLERSQPKPAASPSPEMPPTTWPPSSWQPIPPGWRAMHADEVTTEMGSWTYAVLYHRPAYPLWSTHEKTFDATPVLGRIEWHPNPDLKGVTLYLRA